jgi:DNA polymerase V
MQDDLQPLANSDGVSVHSGFPNPGLARRKQGERLALDLNQLLIKRPSSTYLFRVSGHTWADQGVHDGSVVIVDRAQRLHTNDLVIAWHDGSLVIAKHRQLPPTAEPWGVVTAVIHQYHT